MPHVEVGDARLFFTDEGSGSPPVLLVHGFACDPHDWSWQIPHLALSHRVVAVDLRGHGRSSVPPGGYDVGTLADDLAGLLDQLDTGPIVAIGHSLGGAVVSVLAVERPDLLAGAVVVDPAYLLDVSLKPMLAGVVAAMESGDPHDAVTAMSRGSQGAATPSHLTCWHTRRAAGVPAEVLRLTFAGLYEGSNSVGFFTPSGPYLRRRACKILAFYTDPSRAVLEASLSANPASKAVSWEGSGHWLHQERPDEFNAMVDAWLADAT